VRRIPLAFVILGLLTLLAAGGAVLGALQAPTGTDLAVRNGAGQTLLAQRVTGSYTTSQLNGVVVSFDFRAPDHASEKATGPKGKVEGRRSLIGPQASSVLDPVRQLLSLPKFSAHGSLYQSVLPASVLVPLATRARVTGTYRTQVQLQGGYVVAVFVRIDASEGSQHIVETIEYRLSRVDAWTRAR
jgi:hypothetical protein